MCIAIGSFSLLLALILVATSTSSADNSPLLNDTELQNLVNDVRGDDNRLMRWSATKHTKKRQRNGGCDALSQALEVITSTTASPTLKALACEYATFCVTDNPSIRALLSDYENVHTAIVDMIQSNDAQAVAMASHLIYISSFSNAKNQAGFFNAGAVPALASVVKNTDRSSNLEIMWAAAALQNLAASYCDTDLDGRCYWNWNAVNGEMILSINKKKMTIVSDGDPIRQAMLQDTQLMDRLNELACTGPVHGKMTNENPYVGENAVRTDGIHNNARTIVAWAAAGALKNLALHPKARSHIQVKCLCRLAHSPDWLEENKGQGGLHHVRPKDPCWFNNDDTINGALCVDDNFLDKAGYTCFDYDPATKEECKATNQDGSLTAKKACCGCGGGEAEPGWELSMKKNEKDL